MHTHLRLIAAGVIAVAAMTGLTLAQGAAPPTPPPAGQNPQTPPAPGRGADPGQRGADPAGRGQGGGGRRGGFTQYTRPLAPPDVLVRGKALYETNCASCHAVDLRGTADGKNPNLLRSGTALADKQGELVAAAIAKHTPPITLIEADAVADRRIHPQHPRHDGRAGQPARTQSDERGVERPRGRRGGGPDRLPGRLRDVSLADRRPEGHRLEVSRPARAAERVGRGVERPASAAAAGAAAAAAPAIPRP